MNMFDDDVHLREVIQKIKGSINEGFDKAKKYATTFEKYQKFYVENESLDLQAVREEEHGTFSFFSFFCFNFFLFLLRIALVNDKAKEKKNITFLKFINSSSTLA